MEQGEIDFLVTLAKYILLPAIGFIAGFIAKWYLQDKKSRDELIQALASQRADALRELWAITTLRAEITELEKNEVVPSAPRENANASIMNWYTHEGGALFLSQQATHLVFQLLDTLRREDVTKADLESAVSALRTRLKRDCGIYSYWEAKRQLVRPRPSPWPSKIDK